MSKGKTQWVTRKGDGWAVRGEGNQRDTLHTETQKEAIKRATQIAKNQESEVIIQGQDHKIRERNTYGKDPFPPEG